MVRKEDVIEAHSIRMCDILNGLHRGEISEQDIVDLQTFVAIAIELMNLSSRSVLRQAALNVELRFHLRSEADDSNGS